MAVTATSKSGECSIVTTERQLTAVVKTTVRMEELPSAQRSARGKIDAVIKSLGVAPLSLGCTLWRPPENGRMYMEPGVIVSRPFDPAGEVVPSALPAGRAARFLLVGPFDRLPGAWKTLFEWCKSQGLKPAGTNWEVYGATSADPSKQETTLYVLLA